MREASATALSSRTRRDPVTRASRSPASGMLRNAANAA
ncbi:hypothetical protein MPTA5024_34490 [Microbispora sp. ATCC PTA-5024]|nr:hypothetical protein MPTA5024_34490 [Microbispora sp. ATCC PTA-5024]